MAFLNTGNNAVTKELKEIVDAINYEIAGTNKQWKVIEGKKKEFILRYTSAGGEIYDHPTKFSSVFDAVSKYKRLHGRITLDIDQLYIDVISSEIDSNHVSYKRKQINRIAELEARIVELTTVHFVEPSLDDLHHADSQSIILIDESDEQVRPSVESTRINITADLIDHLIALKKHDAIDISSFGLLERKNHTDNRKIIVDMISTEVSSNPTFNPFHAQYMGRIDRTITDEPAGNAIWINNSSENLES